MAGIRLLLNLAILVICVEETFCHGMIMDPVARGSAWREGFKTPIDVEDSGQYCGGATTQHVQNGGKCGICGDNFNMSQPRPHENGGEYGTGTIVKRYTMGQNVTIKARITANHRGNFYFAVCPLNETKQLETEECFLPIKLASGEDFYVLDQSLTGDIPINITLPENLTCSHCVFRWYWIVGNSWGTCKNGTSGLGCGPQEEFRTCSDIAINNIHSNTTDSSNFSNSSGITFDKFNSSDSSATTIENSSEDPNFSDSTTIYTNELNSSDSFESSSPTINNLNASDYSGVINSIFNSSDITTNHSSISSELLEIDSNNFSNKVKLGLAPMIVDHNSPKSTVSSDFFNITNINKNNINSFDLPNNPSSSIITNNNLDTSDSSELLDINNNNFSNKVKSVSSDSFELLDINNNNFSNKVKSVSSDLPNISSSIITNNKFKTSDSSISPESFGINSSFFYNKMKFGMLPRSETENSDKSTSSTDSPITNNNSKSSKLSNILQSTTNRFKYTDYSKSPKVSRNSFNSSDSKWSFSINMVHHD